MTLESRRSRIGRNGTAGPGFWLLAGTSTATNTRLLDAVAALGVQASRLSPDALPNRLRPGDVLLGRLDVCPALDGVEPGLWSLRRLEREPVTVLNPAAALVACHDKLATAQVLTAAGVPHPRSVLVGRGGGAPALDFPVVLKPRFGSWGRDIVRCAGPEELQSALAAVRDRHWFRLHGALVQELVPPVGRDLRVLVAAGEVVGAVERLAAPGEWRTNVALGGVRRPAVPPEPARHIALAAAAAVGGDLVGVDLLPRPDGGWAVVELNGAVDFTRDYSQPGTDVFDEIALRVVPAALEAAAAPASADPEAVPMPLLTDPAPVQT